MTHQIKLLQKIDVAKDVTAFYFSRPEDFIYKAGQFAELHLPNCKPYFFSFASAPYENNLIFATRKRNSEFKNILFSLPLGSEIKAVMPFGNFTLHPELDIPAVFIAGGIGITPFLSILKQAHHENRQQARYLFYINKTTQDALFFSDSQKGRLSKDKETEIAATVLTLVKQNEPFMVELFEMQFYSQNLSFIPFLPLPVNIETIKDYAKAKYYLCGSPKSVEQFKQLLESVHIPKAQIKVEDFPSYLTSF